MTGNTMHIDDAEVQQLIAQLSARGDDMTPVMREISGIMMAAVERNFELEGQPKWPALAEATIVKRQKGKHWPGKMLQVTGMLAASWHQRSNATQAVVGTIWPTARIHELGGQAGRGHKVTIPARPVARLTDRDIGEIKYLLMQYLFAGK